jgi:hypothetical protein
MPEFLENELTSDEDFTNGTLGTDERSVLGRARCDERCKVAEPSGGEDGDMVIDAEAGGLQSEKTAPACKDDGFGFAMVRPGVEVGCDPTRINFKTTATNAKRGAVAKDKDVGTRRGFTGRGSALPVEVGGGEFFGRVFGRGGLPFTELDAEGRVGIGERSACGVVSPKAGEGFPRILAALNDAPVLMSPLTLNTWTMYVLKTRNCCKN